MDDWDLGYEAAVGPWQQPKGNPMAESCPECRALIEPAEAVLHHGWHLDLQERLEEAIAEAVATSRSRRPTGVRQLRDLVTEMRPGGD
jgi:hypothetical protein